MSELTGLLLALFLSAMSVPGQGQGVDLNALRSLLQSRGFSFGGSSGPAPSPFGGMVPGFGAGGPTPAVGCDLRPDPTSKLRYLQKVNNQEVRRDCAPGTMFKEADCTCVTLDKGQQAMPPSPVLGTNVLSNPSSQRKGGNPLYEDILQKLRADASTLRRPSAPKSRRRKPAPEPKPWSPFTPAGPGSLKPIPTPVKPKSRAKTNPSERFKSFFVPSVDRATGSPQATKAKATSGPAKKNAGPLPSELLKMLTSSNRSPGPQPTRAAPHRRRKPPTRAPPSGNADTLAAIVSAIRGSISDPKPRPTKASPSSRRGGAKGDRLSEIMSMLSPSGGHGRRSHMPSGGRSRGGSGFPSVRGAGLAPPSIGSNAALTAMLAAGGGGGDAMAALAGLSVPSGIRGFSTTHIAALTGETPGANVMSNMDTADLLNLQGALSGQGLAGIQSLNPMQLATWDRADRIDAGDLNQFGMAAFARMAG